MTFLRRLFAVLCFVGCTANWARSAEAVTNTPGLEFINTSFENASPLWWETGPDQTTQIHLTYDHERSSPNRAAGHIHFQVQAKPGTTLKLDFDNLENIYNGRLGSVARELGAVVVSEDGKQWRSVATELVASNRVRLTLEMTAPQLYVARVQPYRISDLEQFLGRIAKNPQVEISPIGQTVEGRRLEIVRVGSPSAPHRVFLRARAHPWEPGGNWVVEGLVERLLRGDAQSQQWLKEYCVYILPMANKDGVARGRTRFNAMGKDLNRNWDQPADRHLAPENAALEDWLTGMIRQNKKPHLALELHNDGNGMLHISRPPVPDLQRYLDRMATFEQLLRQHTWFTEGSTKGGRNSGTLGEGWLERFGIDAAVHEFNCQWIAGLKERPLAQHWKQYGEGLAKVFSEYFRTVKP